ADDGDAAEGEAPDGTDAEESDAEDPDADGYTAEHGTRPGGNTVAELLARMREAGPVPENLGRRRRRADDCPDANDRAGNAVPHRRADPVRRLVSYLTAGCRRGAQRDILAWNVRYLHRRTGTTLEGPCE